MVDPLTTLLDRAPAAPWPLPPALAERYGGPLGFPARETAYTIANFVSTLDGVVSYALPGRAGGGPISGHNAPDRFIMGLLRACADAVVIGAGTLRSARPDHTWTPGYIFPDAAADYAELRRALGQPPQPLTVVVTGRGDLDWGAAALHAPDVAALVVTTDAGAAALHQRGRPPEHVTVRAAGPGPEVTAQAVLAAVADVTEAGGAPGAPLVLVEGGPQLLSAFVAERRLDELFLTLAPQIAGRDEAHARPALVVGHAFLPETAPWARAASVKSAGDHLYLRYAF